MSKELSGAFSFVTLTVGELKSVLPAVINDLKFAKKGLASIANTLDSVMTVLGLKAPPLFYKIASLYRAVWVSYFMFFSIATLAVLFYGFWASGYFHGPEPTPEEEQFYQAPQTFREKLCSCWTACGGCFSGCADSHLFFWSMILLAEATKGDQKATPLEERKASRSRCWDGRRTWPSLRRLLRESSHFGQPAGLA